MSKPGAKAKGRPLGRRSVNAFEPERFPVHCRRGGSRLEDSLCQGQEALARSEAELEVGLASAL